MAINIEEKDLNKFIMVGDRVLVRPKNPLQKTKSGLYLPPTVQENEQLQCGYILKVGPGYPIPSSGEPEDFWKQQEEEVKYIPLQTKEGDLAVYLPKGGFEIEFNNEKYIILPQSAILMLIRDEGIFE